MVDVCSILDSNLFAMLDSTLTEFVAYNDQEKGHSSQETKPVIETTDENFMKKVFLNK